jgi:hypothetical protein
MELPDGFLVSLQPPLIEHQDSRARQSGDDHHNPIQRFFENEEAGDGTGKHGDGYEGYDERSNYPESHELAGFGFFISRLGFGCTLCGHIASIDWIVRGETDKKIVYPICFICALKVQ